jgi:hypothetical protein
MRTAEPGEMWRCGMPAEALVVLNLQLRQLVEPGSGLPRSLS